ncbi:hypothetical protein SteCoe_37663 [Stentor coeruleus]|uniref:Uncharacterized protein n=1 Tax=Stentor coeruleus TaxID=5963 RepID=A0A1R2AML4_9CILI|nr:hypothetical protein SteCoe_37663 [Stentor coeruleus]
MEIQVDRKFKKSVEPGHKSIKVFANGLSNRPKRPQDHRVFSRQESDKNLSPDSKPQINPLYTLKEFSNVLGSKLSLSLPSDSLESISAFLSKKMNNIISCTLQDLHEGVRVLLESITNFEKFNQKTCTLTLGSCEFLLKINGKDLPMMPKSQISSFLSRDWDKIVPGTKKYTEFPSSIIDMCRNYEESMLEAYAEIQEPEIVINNCKKISYQSQLAIKMQLEMLKKSENDQKKLKTQLEWEKTELKVLRAMVKQKKNDMQSEIENLKTKRLAMAHESVKAEKEIDKVNKKQETIQKALEKMMRFFEELDEESRKNAEFVEVRNNDKDFSVVEEIETLEEQLKKLDGMLRRCRNEEVDQINTQIYRIKTKISSLKSISAINDVTSMRKNTKNAMNNLNRVYSIDDIKKRTPIKRYTAMLNSPIMNNDGKIFPSSTKEFGAFKSYNSTTKIDRYTLEDCEFEDSGNLDYENTRPFDDKNAFSPKNIGNKFENLRLNMSKINPLLDLKIHKSYDFSTAQSSDVRENDIKLEDIEKIRSNAVEKEIEFDLKLKELKVQKIKIQEERGRLLSKIHNLRQYLQECCEEISLAS